MSKPEVIKVGFKRLKIALLFLISVGFIPIGVLMVQAKDDVFTTVFGVFGCVFFGVCAVVIGALLLKPGPALEISDKGILNKSNLLSPQLIQWGDIIDAYIVSVSSNKFITIVVRNPEEYIKTRNKFLVYLQSANFNMTGSPINISLSSVNIDGEEFVDLIFERLKEFHKSQDDNFPMIDANGSGLN